MRVCRESGQGEGCVGRVDRVKVGLTSPHRLVRTIIILWCRVRLRQQATGVIDATLTVIYCLLQGLRLPAEGGRGGQHLSIEH